MYYYCKVSVYVLCCVAFIVVSFLCVHPNKHSQCSFFSGGGEQTNTLRNRGGCRLQLKCKIG